MQLTADNTLIVFTTAPTGLGHIRVMDAIKDGLKPQVANVAIGVENINANKIHALGSRIPLFTKITEFYQTNPLAERIVTNFYVRGLKRNRDEITSSFATIANDYPERKAWVVISTHFALAHSILAAKKDLEGNFGIKLINCVVISDDSPQRVWAIKDADLIFAPSEKTRDGLVRLGVKPENIKVVSFPISPRLTQKLTKDEYQFIVDQVEPQGEFPLQISIPISGAAVQLTFFENLMKILSQDAFEFSVIGISSSYTIGFFERVLKLPHVQASIGSTSYQTVNLYESLFNQPKRPAIEITKPSEQTFKALVSPNQRGGVILLLTDPVGRQEYDNLNFLVRHKLMPDKTQQARLEGFLLKATPLTAEEKALCHYNSSHWRAVKLPSDPASAALFIKKLREEGIFASMMGYIGEPKPELTSDGVKQIWEEINNYLDNYNKLLTSSH